MWAEGAASGLRALGETYYLKRTAIKVNARGRMNMRAGRPYALVAVTICLILLALTVPPVAAYERPTTLERVDIPVGSSTPQEDPDATGDSRRQTAISNSRYVAFVTTDPLDPIDTNQVTDIYLRDVVGGKTELISRSSSGLPAVGPPDVQTLTTLSTNPAITPDGRYVVFDSEAINLVPGDTNGIRDVFVFDRKNAVMKRASLDSQDEQAEGLPLVTWFARASISDNGRFVSFTSTADTLVEGDTNEGPDVFVRDMKLGVTTRVSVDSEGNEVTTTCNPAWCLPTDGGISSSSISSSGLYVAFDSLSGELVEGDTNRTWDVFVHDLETKETERASVASDGSEALDLTGTGTEALSWSGSNLSGDGGLTKPTHSFSADGRYVTFASLASNLVPNDTNRSGKVAGFPGGQDVFVHDRRTGRTERVSTDSHGGELHKDPSSITGRSSSASISADGRFVGFRCECSRGWARPAIYDRHSGALHEISIPEGNFLTLDLAPSGRYLSLAIAGRWRIDVGETLGVGGFEGEPSEPAPGEDPIICIEGVCIPPGSAVSSGDGDDDVDDLLNKQGANLDAVSISYRPQYSDLFVAIELENMPKVVPGASPLFYGMRFKVEDRKYEVRATSLNFGTFGLFDCTESVLCTKLADLRGGYGTTGMRVVFSLPLDDIELENGGELEDVTAYSGLGSYTTGATKVLDSLRFR